MTNSGGWLPDSPPGGKIVLGVVAITAALTLGSDAVFRWSAADDGIRTTFPILALIVGVGGVLVLIQGIRRIRRIRRDRAE